MSLATPDNGGRFPRQKFAKKNGAQTNEESEDDNQFYRYRTPPRSNSLNPTRNPQNSGSTQSFQGHITDIKTLTDRYLAVNENRRQLVEIFRGSESLQVSLQKSFKLPKDKKFSFTFWESAQIFFHEYNPIRI